MAACRVVVNTTAPLAQASHKAAQIFAHSAGGRPQVEAHIPGHEHGISSDGFFELEEQPKKAFVVGAG